MKKYQFHISILIISMTAAFFSAALIFKIGDNADGQLQARAQTVSLEQISDFFDTDLYYGMIDSQTVSDLQEFLVEEEYLVPELVTGNYLSATYDAVKQFQRSHGIITTGYFGPLTRAVVNKILAEQSGFEATPTVSVSQLVEDFPEIPMYLGAKLKDFSVDYEDGYTNYAGTWLSGDSVPQIMKWYIEALENEGWIIDISPADPNASAVQVVTAENEDLILNLSVIHDNNLSLTKIVAEFINVQQLEEETEADVTI